MCFGMLCILNLTSLLSSSVEHETTQDSDVQRPEWEDKKMFRILDDDDADMTMACQHGTKSGCAGWERGFGCGRSSLMASRQWKEEEWDVISGERLQVLAEVTLTTEEWELWHTSLSTAIREHEYTHTKEHEPGQQQHQVLRMGPNGELSAEQRAILQRSRSVFVYSHLLPKFFLGEKPI